MPSGSAPDCKGLSDGSLGDGGLGGVTVGDMVGAVVGDHVSPTPVGARVVARTYITFRQVES